MKLKLHSQSQSRDWILHWSASIYGKSYGLLLFFLSPCAFLSGPGWSRRTGCALNISQWWLILRAAARSWVERFWFHRQILQLLSVRPKSFFHSWFISLYLSVPPPLSVSVSVFLFKSFTLHLFPGLFSLAQIYLQHATFGHASPGFEVCLLRVFVCRTPKLPLWNATFGIWRMRFKCWRQTAYWTQRTEKRKSNRWRSTRTTLSLWRRR